MLQNLSVNLFEECHPMIPTTPSEQVTRKNQGRIMVLMYCKDLLSQQPLRTFLAPRKSLSSTSPLSVAGVLLSEMRTLCFLHIIFSLGGAQQLYRWYKEPRAVRALLGGLRTSRVIIYVTLRTCGL